MAELIEAYAYFFDKNKVQQSKKLAQIANPKKGETAQTNLLALIENLKKDDENIKAWANIILIAIKEPEE